MGSFTSKVIEEPPSERKTLSEEQLTELKQQLLSSDDGEIPVATLDDLEDQGRLYTRLRSAVWNLDKVGWPAVIVQPKTSQHIATCVKFAKQHALDVCVRSAGAHSGHALVTDCLTIDLSLMRQVTVDPVANTATVAAGAMIGDVDDACKPHDLALVMGQGTCQQHSVRYERLEENI